MMDVYVVITTDEGGAVSFVEVLDGPPRWSLPPGQDVYLASVNGGDTLILAKCPDCGHVAHEGERCAGHTDCDEHGMHPCVCSWPDPGNYVCEHDECTDPNRCQHWGPA